MSMKNFEDFTKQIADEYKTLGLKRGCRFSYGPKETFYKNNGILIIGLNPGGGKEERTDILPPFENGNAYLLEKWGVYDPGKHPLQKQILCLFKGVAAKINSNPLELINHSFTSNIIPFRSINLETLPRKEEIILFSKDLWNKILDVLNPNLIVAIGKQGYSILQEIYFEKGFVFEINEEKIPINWGNYKTYISELKKDKNKILLIGFPHLSTFKFIGRDKSKNATETIIEKISFFMLHSQPFLLR